MNSVSRTRAFALIAAVMLASPMQTISAQNAGGRPATLPAQDPTTRLRSVLPADVAERVIAKITEARAKGLAADALEQRALKFAARGIAPAAIEKSVADQAARQSRAADVLLTARARRADAGEIDAAAEAMRQGVDNASIATLAKSAPAGRSLAVPLTVLGDLSSRGLPSDQALARVTERLSARASDREIAELSADAAMKGRPSDAGRPALTGQDLAATKRPAGAGAAGGASAGAPVGVPATPGSRKPTTPRRGPPPV